jgi:hypothetical protein
MLSPTITATADAKVMIDRDAAAQIDRRRFDGAGLKPLAVGGKSLQQAILDDDREAERHQQRRQQPMSQRAVEENML